MSEKINELILDVHYFYNPDAPKERIALSMDLRKGAVDWVKDSKKRHIVLLPYKTDPVYLPEISHPEANAEYEQFVHETLDPEQFSFAEDKDSIGEGPTDLIDKLKALGPRLAKNVKIYFQGDFLELCGIDRVAVVAKAIQEHTNSNVTDIIPMHGERLGEKWHNLNNEEKQHVMAQLSGEKPFDIEFTDALAKDLHYKSAYHNVPPYLKNKIRDLAMPIDMKPHSLRHGREP